MNTFYSGKYKPVREGKKTRLINESAVILFSSSYTQAVNV